MSAECAPERGEKKQPPPQTAVSLIIMTSAMENDSGGVKSSEGQYVNARSCCLLAKTTDPVDSSPVDRKRLKPLLYIDLEWRTSVSSDTAFPPFWGQTKLLTLQENNKTWHARHLPSTMASLNTGRSIRLLARRTAETFVGGIWDWESQKDYRR